MPYLPAQRSIVVAVILLVASSLATAADKLGQDDEVSKQDVPDGVAAALPTGRRRLACPRSGRRHRRGVPASWA
jgi:hypothetical protein